MQSNSLAGGVAGLIAGVLFGVAMQIMQAPTPEGGHVPMIAMVAQVVRSSSLAVGWVYHLFNSAVIGALFGWLLGERARSGFVRAAGWGAAYGVLWWVLGALILMPLALGMPAFASLRMPMMRSVALGSLMGHLMYGLMLGTAFVWLRRVEPRLPLGSARHT